MFETYLKRWNLIPDGDLITTPTAHLLPVCQNGKPTIIKLANVEEERFGAALMEWWDGDGAAPVLASDGNALLLERAEDTNFLAAMSRSGRDDQACRILCAVAAKLHRPRKKPLPPLIPLSEWFTDLSTIAASRGGILTRCSAAANMLLANPQEVGILHGDLHHANILDFGKKGWLAIDPKGLYGERGFDFANIFLNPDLENADIAVATNPEYFEQRLEIVCQYANLNRDRLLLWILAWSGLSASWFLMDNQPADINLTIAKMAAAKLDLIS